MTCRGQRVGSTKGAGVVILNSHGTPCLKSRGVISTEGKIIRKGVLRMIWRIITKI